MSKLLYKRKEVLLYCGDCLEYMPYLKRGIADVVIFDPPWGNNHTSRRFGSIIGNDGSFDVIDAVKKILKVLRQYGHAWIFGPENFPWDFRSFPVTNLKKHVWYKGTSGMGTPMNRSSGLEMIQFFRNVKNAKNNNHLQKVPPEGLFNLPRKSNKRTHPYEKPIEIIYKMLEFSTQLGDTILDPCAGTGVTLVAAALRNRKAIGIEIDPSHCEIAVKRLDEIFDLKDRTDSLLAKDRSYFIVDLPKNS